MMHNKNKSRFNYENPPNDFQYRKVYVDRFGYLRFADNDYLVHRTVAHDLYLEHPEKYPLDFTDYTVHHIDGNKWNNTPANLELITPKNHAKKHPHLQNQVHPVQQVIKKRKHH